MRRRRLFLIIGFAFIVHLAFGLFVTRDTWRDWMPGHGAKLESPPDPIIDGRPLQEWVKDLSDVNPALRRSAAETLGHNGKLFPRDDKVAEAVSRLLHDPNAQVRAAALFALGEVHLWARGQLTTSQDEQSEFRSNALEALVPFIDEDERVKARFRMALEDKNPAVRDSAFELLTSNARPASSALSLMNGALKSKQDDVRLRALAACCRLGFDARDSLGSLCDLLEDRNPDLRRKAAEAVNTVTLEPKRDPPQDEDAALSYVTPNPPVSAKAANSPVRPKFDWTSSNIETRSLSRQNGLGQIPGFGEHAPGQRVSHALHFK